jgi:pimeloyl-ACP methyl ester carboxylesterase
VSATAGEGARASGIERPEAAVPRAWTAIGPREAPALVFVHGTRLTRAQWWPQLRQLSRAYRCIAIDLPGHGVLADRSFTIAAAVEVVRRAVDEEASGGRAVIVGLSLGGYVAIDVADTHPDRVAGLVLAGCSAEPVGPSAAPFRLFRVLLARTPHRLQDLVNRGFFRARYRRSVAEPVIEGGFWPAGGADALGALLGRRYLDRLARLWTPVLLLNGALDPLFGPGGEYWAASCRRGTHAVIPNAMHLSSLDRPVTFARHVARFANLVARGG